VGEKKFWHFSCACEQANFTPIDAGHQRNAWMGQFVSANSNIGQKIEEILPKKIRGFEAPAAKGDVR
jgi:hypothetical protein